MKKSTLVVAFVAVAVASLYVASATFSVDDFLVDTEERPFDSLRRYRRQSNDAKKGTDLCTESELKVVVDKLTACNKKAEDILVEAFLSTDEVDIFNVLCESIRAKLTCIDTHVPTCLKPDKVSIFRLNFLGKETEKATNSSFLGPDFIKTCPELNNYQSDLVKDVFGTTKCSYDDAIAKLDELGSCKNETKRKHSRKIDITLNFFEHATREERTNKLFVAYCDYEVDWFNCYQRTTFLCMNQDKIREKITQQKADFKVIENDLKEIGLRFSYDECSKYRGNDS